MSYRLVLRELSNGSKEYIDNIHKQYCEIFQQKFQKYEDELASGESGEDNEKYIKYKQARDEHFARIKEQIANKVGDVFYNEYLTKQATQDRIVEVCEKFSDNELDTFRRSKAIRALQNNTEDVDKLFGLLSDSQQEILNDKDVLKEETRDLQKLLPKLSRTILKVRDYVNFCHNRTQIFMFIFCSFQDIENHVDSSKLAK